jgi:hypothetical protein
MVSSSSLLAVSVYQWLPRLLSAPSRPAPPPLRGWLLLLVNAFAAGDDQNSIVLVEQRETRVLYAVD